MKIALLVLLLVGWVSFAQAQRFAFINYSLAEGLPQSQVSAIVEDQDGYLWVGTLGGLARFNGSSFVNFSSENGLLNNRITSLQYMNNELWIGHEGGVSRAKNGKFTSWSFTSENKNTNVSQILYFENQLVVATNGCGLFTLQKDKLVKVSGLKNDQERIRDLEVFNHKLYIATKEGVFYTSDLRQFFEKNPAGAVINASGFTLANNEMFVTSFDEGIFKLDAESNKLSLWAKAHDEMAPRSSIFTKNKQLWSYSRQGILIHYSGTNYKVLDESKGLPINAISFLFEDQNGSIWIGTEGKGLLRFPGEQFNYFKIQNGIQSELITASLQVNKDTYLFGTFDKGVIHYSKKTKKFSPIQMESNTVWALTKDEFGTIWAGTEVGLEKIVGNKAIAFTKEDGAPGSKVSTFFKEKNDKIWVGGSEGISIIEKGKIRRIAKSSNQDIGTIRNLIRYKGKLICAADGGLFSFEANKFELYLKLKKTSYTLAIDADNQLWIGTEDGLYVSDGKKRKLIQLSDQAASSFVNFLNFYNNQLFVGTNNGLYVLTDVNLNTPVSIQHFGIEDGLINLESNLNSSYLDDKGRLWFGTAEGLSVFQTSFAQAKKETAATHLNLKEILLNFQKFRYSDYSQKLSETGLPTYLKLPHTKNNLIFELDGVSLKNAKDIRYQYILLGQDETWSPTFKNPQLSLSNLKSGDYILKIRAVNLSGTISNTVQLPIYITPAFYQTWWFYLLCVLAVSGLVILFFKQRIQRERTKNYREQLEFKSRLLVLEQQSLNASMNRHFIFNSLNSIQYFINTQDKVLANRYLTNFAKLIRKNLDSSTEENNMVPLSEELERLQLYLSLESMRFRNRFEYEIQTKDIDTENVYVPAMLLQPFVENSIIHGILPVEDRVGMIRIEVEKFENQLQIKIQDNGIGIDFSREKKKGDLGDHRSQGMEITSKRIELLQKLSDQNFELKGPFQTYDSNRLINGTCVLLNIPYENLEDED